MSLWIGTGLQKEKNSKLSKRSTFNVSKNRLPLQVRPHPLEQHFCFPGHLLSPVQFIPQGPSPSTGGQVPVLTTKIKKSHLINWTASLTPPPFPGSLYHTICNIYNNLVSFTSDVNLKRLNVSQFCEMRKISHGLFHSHI